MRWSTVRPCVVEARSSRRHSASRFLDDRWRETGHGPQVGCLGVDGTTSRFQLAELDDERGDVGPRLDCGDQPRDALLDLLPLAVECALVQRVVAFGELNNLLNGLGCQRATSAFT
jgi:hypothetical protein